MSMFYDLLLISEDSKCYIQVCVTSEEVTHMLHTLVCNMCVTHGDWLANTLLISSVSSLDIVAPLLKFFSGG